MGEVYKARDTKLDRDVAIKILPPDVTSAELLRRFEQEARAASSLNHPNIVAIYDIGRVDDIAYIAMELVEGQTLRAAILDRTVPLKEALRIAAKLADVLASAHERGVVHRDLKPENVMISRDGYIKLLDFGLAKMKTTTDSGDNTEPHTRSGHVFGTASYMSPEQAAARAVDFRSDQFSLGVILYEMVGGRRPFDRATNAETLTAIIREDAPPLPQLSGGLTAELQQVIDRCLAKAPHDRYASTRDLARDLRELRDRLTLGSGERSGRSLRIAAPRLPVVVAIAVVVVLITGAVMLLNRSHATLPQRVEAKTLAVLPFRDLSGSGDRAFADGISEMISARLAQASALRVIAPFEEATQRRGAPLLLNGSVQRVNEQLRVSYQLTDASGSRLAGDMVTAPSADVFTLEDLVADNVLQALNVTRTKPARVAASSLTGTAQRIYTEAVGLLQRMNDEQSLDRAIRSLESLLADSRDSATVNATLGKALLRKYSLSRNRALVDQAAVYAERAVQIDPGDADAQVTVGELRRVSGHLPEAAVSFQRALALRNDSLDACLGLADTYDAMGRAADAERLYREALTMRPDAPDVYGGYGKFCYARGRYADAARLFTTQTQLLPEAPRAFANLGAAHQALGQNEEAMRAYQRSISIRPTSGGYSNLGMLQFSLGCYAEAAEQFEKAAALPPTNYLLWANLGEAYRWAPGQRAKSGAAYERALRLIREAIAVNANDSLARAIAASCLAKRGDLAAAQTHLKLALETDPTNANALYQAAVVANLRGDRNAAVSWLTRAIAAGYTATDAARDPEFSNLRKDPRFLKAVYGEKPKA